MTRTTAVLPPDHPAPGRRRTANHHALAEQMRQIPGVWVLVSEPATRKAAQQQTYRIRAGYGPYRSGRYAAEVRRSLTGRNEVWARYERKPR